jgi:hypothetical protein
VEKSRTADPEFALRLNKLLKEKGIRNNAEFARAISKAPMVTHGWMKGKFPRLPDDWKALTGFLECSSDHLLLGKERHQSIKITIEIPITNSDLLPPIITPDTDESHGQAFTFLVQAITSMLKKNLDKK